MFTAYKRFELLLCVALWSASVVLGTGCGSAPDEDGGVRPPDQDAGSPSNDAGDDPFIWQFDGGTAGVGGAPSAGAGGSGGSAGSFAGGGDLMFWNRIESMYNYETDIAFGHIKGQSAERVYMCEWNSPTAGLYKGTRIRPNMIHWDAAYGLPDYEVRLLAADRMTFVPQTSTNDFLGTYAPGTWRAGSCDFELKDGELIDSSRYVYIYTGDLAVSLQSVTVGGVRIPLTSSADGCGAGVKLPKPSGSQQLAIVATFTGVGVDGSYTRTEQSAMGFGELEAGCNRIVASDQGCPRTICFGVNNAPLPVRPQVEQLQLPVLNQDRFEDIVVDDAHMYILSTPSIWQCDPTGCGTTAKEIVKTPCCDESCTTRCPSGETQFSALALAGSKLFAKRSYPVEGLDVCDLTAPECTMTPFLRTDETNAPYGLWVANGRIYWFAYNGVSTTGDTYLKEVRACPLTGCVGEPTVVYSGSLLEGAYPNGFAVSATDIFFLTSSTLYRIPLIDADHADTAQGKKLLENLYETRGLDIDGSTLRWTSAGGKGYLYTCTLPACDSVSELLDVGWGIVNHNSTHVYIDSWRFAK